MPATECHVWHVKGGCCEWCETLAVSPASSRATTERTTSGSSVVLATQALKGVFGSESGNGEEGAQLRCAATQPPPARAHPPGEVETAWERIWRALTPIYPATRHVASPLVQ